MAGYEDAHGAERPSLDPAIRAIVDRKKPKIIILDMRSSESPTTVIRGAGLRPTPRAL